MSDRSSIIRIKVVNDALEELASQVVFVGGATVSLYRDRIVSESRVTDDVDIVIEIAAYGEFAKIEEKLRQKGFINEMTSNVICRYSVNGVIVDVMPTKGDILGFTNQWYAEGVKHAIMYKIDDETQIKIFDAAHFLASKIEAFKNRGENDGRISSDFEDIVYILNSRNTIWEEMKHSPTNVKEYLSKNFQQLLKNEYLYEWISVHIDLIEQKRVTQIIGGINIFISKEY